MWLDLITIFETSIENVFRLSEITVVLSRKKRVPLCLEDVIFVFQNFLSWPPAFFLKLQNLFKSLFFIIFWQK